MLFSIVIPYFNGYKTINRCIESIYSQGLDSRLFEIIIVDDASTDNISSNHADRLTNAISGGVIYESFTTISTSAKVEPEIPALRTQKGIMCYS